MLSFTLALVKTPVKRERRGGGLFSTFCLTFKGEDRGWLSFFSRSGFREERLLWLHQAASSGGRQWQLHACSVPFLDCSSSRFRWACCGKGASSKGPPVHLHLLGPWLKKKKKRLPLPCSSLHLPLPDCPETCYPISSLS